MTLLVIGRNGQLATELARLDDVTTAGRALADLSNPQGCADLILATDCTAVINAAAYTAVDKAEEDEALATAINGQAPAAMARACAQKGIPFVHVSTDYVFDGEGDVPFKPDDPTGPLGAYGRTKLAGEDGIRATGSTFAILRTSWVVSSHGNNFVKTMLRLSQSRNELSIVADQIGGPTPAAALAAACHSVARQLIKAPEKSGTYHFCGAPDTSWADFAREIFRQAGKAVTVRDIPTSAYPTPARRPLNSRMDCSSLLTQFGLSRPDWRVGLSHILNELYSRN